MNNFDVVNLFQILFQNLFQLDINKHTFNY